MDQSTPEYRQAFQTYLRRGAPIGLSLHLMQQQKQEREIEWQIKNQKRWPNQDKVRSRPKPTTHYIWRTRGDGKVRSRHAENNGKIFAWDDPPPTGHPGEDYNCRCIAEPYYPRINEHMTLSMSGMSDSSPAWSTIDFIKRYRSGRGGRVKLRDTGNLQRIVDAYQERVGFKFLGQIAQAARDKAGLSFGYPFKNKYKMEFVVFSLGTTTIGGRATGSSQLNDAEPGALTITGIVNFYLSDAFTDPLDVFNSFEGEYNPGGKEYEIHDSWQGRFSGKVNVSPALSKYRYYDPLDLSIVMP